MCFCLHSSGSLLNIAEMQFKILIGWMIAQYMAQKDEKRTQKASQIARQIALSDGHTISDKEVKES